MELRKELEGSILLSKVGIIYLKIEDTEKLSLKEKEHINTFDENRFIEFNGMKVFIHPKTKVFEVYYKNENKPEYMFFENMKDVMGRNSYCVLNRKGHLEYITRDGNKLFKEIIFE